LGKNSIQQINTADCKGQDGQAAKSSLNVCMLRFEFPIKGDMSSSGIKTSPWLWPWHDWLGSVAKKEIAGFIGT
jgi:hypothetical protein